MFETILSHECSTDRCVGVQKQSHNLSNSDLDLSVSNPGVPIIFVKPPSSKLGLVRIKPTGAYKHPIRGERPELCR